MRALKHLYSGMFLLVLALYFCQCMPAFKENEENSGDSSDSTIVTDSSESSSATGLTSVESSIESSAESSAVSTAEVDLDKDKDGYETDVDCNDNDREVNPGKTEIPYNGKDDDCNANTLDDDLDQDTYVKLDDCDDTNPNINPGKTEIPYNGVDDDCKPGTPDEDLDGDSYSHDADCNDHNVDIHPGAEEICDGVDNNCDGDIDGRTSGAQTAIDDDGDDFCDRDFGGDDCDDTSAEMNPGQTEIIGNGKDDDCNPGTPDVVIDTDEDGYNSMVDCNDLDPNVNPGKTEIIYNGKDDDCNPETKDDDLDGDTYTKDQDCDDNDDDVNPGKTEIVGNGKDDDCNPDTADEAVAITSLKVTVITADVQKAGTDDNIYLILNPDKPKFWLNNGGENDFEQGNHDTFYYGPDKMNPLEMNLCSITEILIQKDPDNTSTFGPWMLGGITIWINEQEEPIYQNLNINIWLKDGSLNWIAVDWESPCQP